MLNDSTGELAGDDGNQRSKQDRRAESNRRKINEDRTTNERRDLNEEGRRSWIARRQPPNGARNPDIP